MPETQSNHRQLAALYKEQSDIEQALMDMACDWTVKKAHDAGATKLIQAYIEARNSHQAIGKIVRNVVMVLSSMNPVFKTLFKKWSRIPEYESNPLAIHNASIAVANYLKIYGDLMLQTMAENPRMFLDWWVGTALPTCVRVPVLHKFRNWKSHSYKVGMVWRYRHLLSSALQSEAVQDVRIARALRSREIRDRLAECIGDSFVMANLSTLNNHRIENFISKTHLIQNLDKLPKEYAERKQKLLNKFKDVTAHIENVRNLGKASKSE